MELLTYNLYVNTISNYMNQLAWSATKHIAKKYALPYAKAKVTQYATRTSQSAALSTFNYAKNRIMKRASSSKYSRPSKRRRPNKYKSSMRKLYIAPTLGQANVSTVTRFGARQNGMSADLAFPKTCKVVLKYAMPNFSLDPSRS